MFSSQNSQVSQDAVFIEDVFSTWLYTGTGAAQTITNGIDLAGKGGLVWVKNRGPNNGNPHILVDTVRGVNNNLRSNEAIAQYTQNTVDAFNANGFRLTATNGDVNLNTWTYASWTFREQPKFFDVVTWTGDGSGTFRNIPHNLGSVPGCIIYKRTDAASDWNVYHRSLGNDGFLQLNTTGAEATPSDLWNYTDPTSTQFTVGYANTTGRTYVAYLFAHNAGGFGLTGTDNVISCGSFTANGSGAATVNLEYEPQWVVTKSATSVSNWFMNDNMRGMSVTDSQMLRANTSGAEDTFSPAWVAPTATGFNFAGGSASQTYIYIAIRRGPMKVPTTGTSVFAPTTTTSTNAFSVGFPTDLGMFFTRDSTRTWNTMFSDRLRGNVNLVSSTPDAEAAGSNMDFTLQNSFRQLITSTSSVCYTLRRAPGFFDEVCNSSGSDSQMLLNHNLGVAPEMIIKKLRNGSANWHTWASGIPFGNIFDGPSTNGAAYTNGSLGNTTPPSATQFQTYQQTGLSYVYYLFASCPGVSKVGSYTGTGTTQTINCGFTAGARFVLVKTTSTTGNWLVWDSARGIVAGNDPYLRLNSADAEVTNTDWVDTAATGFELSNAGGNLANSNGVSYVFFAVA